MLKTHRECVKIILNTAYKLDKYIHLQPFLMFDIYESQTKIGTTNRLPRGGTSDAGSVLELLFARMHGTLPAAHHA